MSSCSGMTESDCLKCHFTLVLFFQMHGGAAKFSELYELQEDIGVGSYSICKRCVHRVSAMDYAVKVGQIKMCRKCLSQTKYCFDSLQYVPKKTSVTLMFCKNRPLFNRYFRKRKRNYDLISPLG